MRAFTVPYCADSFDFSPAVKMECAVQFFECLDILV